MHYYNYFLLFPEGETQEIEHSLKFGDMVDVNGNIYSIEQLNPRSITYKVTGISNNTKFKETTYYYKLEMYSAKEVKEEIVFNDLMNKKDNLLNKILTKLEKKARKRS